MSSTSAKAPKSCINLETTQALDLIAKLLRDVSEVEFSVDDDLNVELRPLCAGHTPSEPTASDSQQEALVLIPDTGQVRIEGQPVEVLSRQEYDLLSHLYARPGVICSKEEICQVLWPDRSAPSCTAALDKLISRLRAKIEIHGGRPRYLLTVRGRGYQLKTS